MGPPCRAIWAISKEATAGFTLHHRHHWHYSIRKNLLIYPEIIKKNYGRGADA